MNRLANEHLAGADAESVEMSDGSQELMARLEALEIHVAHLGQVIADMNGVITDQWSKIDALQREISYLRIELQTMGPQREGPEAPPPHY